MKIEITPKDGKLGLRIEYLKKEWEALKNYYESNPNEYRRGYSSNLFGTGLGAEVYFCRRDKSDLGYRISQMVSEMIPDSERADIRVIDDINDAPLFCENGRLHLNIAIFRCVPWWSETSNRYVFEVELPDRFVYVPGIRYFRYVVKAMVKALGIYERGKKLRVIYRVEVVEE
jgi:hypothetical protein